MRTATFVTYKCHEQPGLSGARHVETFLGKETEFIISPSFPIDVIASCKVCGLLKDGVLHQEHDYLVVSFGGKLLHQLCPDCLGPRNQGPSNFLEYNRRITNGTN